MGKKSMCGKSRQWFYNKSKGKCVKAKGCKGTGFKNKNACAAGCMASVWCARPMKTGKNQCPKQKRQYYYNPVSNKCIKYKGCNGFSSKGLCTSMCQTSP